MDQMSKRIAVIQNGRGTLITLPKDIVYFNVNGGEAELSVLTNLDWDTDIKSENGFTFEKIDKNKLKVTVSPNNTGSQREIAVTLKEKGGDKSAILTVIQTNEEKMLNITLTPESKDVLLSKGTNEIEIPVITNLEYDLEISGSSWISVTSAPQFSGGDIAEDIPIKISVSANTSGVERNGYISSEYEHEGVSKSVEYAYNMYCIATVAKLQGREDLYREYIAKAQYYKNLFNPANTFIQPKENGRFTPDFDPTQIDQNYTEGNGWHYTFYAPHDINTLIDLMGGDEAFCTKLDSCFFTDSKTSGRVQADVTGLIGQYCHGNEPSQHTAYLYAYAGKAYRTQELVRRILTELYSNRPDGICGNDDAGQMSAWFVMSAMGFYPFDKVTINLENGKKFEIIAQGAEQNAYVRSLKLNGKEYDKTYLNYDDIKDGGVLEFAMTDKPIMEFGRAESSRPTSRIKDNLICISPSLSYEGTGTFTDSLTVDVNAFCKDDTIVVEFGDGTCRNFLGEGSFSIHDSRNIVIYAKNGTSSQSVECRFYKIPKGRSIKILTKYDPQYTAGGDQGLIDLKRGTDNWKLGCWQGYWGEDLEAVIDLGEKQRIKRVGGNFIQDEKSWIFMPLTVEYHVSDDGINFRLLEKIDNEIPQDKSGCITHTFFTSKEINARYIKIKAKNTGVNPDWHLSKGEKAWLFTDEIIIE